MKQRLSMLLIGALALSSCGLFEPQFAPLEDWNYSFNDGGMSFTSLEGICTWVTTNVLYDTDIDQWGCNEYWASPEQTFSTRKGDCEDKTILFMYFAHAASLAADPQLVAVLVGDNLGHALVRVGGTYYDPTSGTWGAWSELTDPVMYTLSYGETMYIASHDHDAAQSRARGVRLDAASPCTPATSRLDSPCYNADQNQARSHDVGAAASPTTLRYHAPSRRAPSTRPEDLVDQRRGAAGR
jgi:hypothetical protein